MSGALGTWHLSTGFELHVARAAYLSGIALHRPGAPLDCPVRILVICYFFSTRADVHMNDDVIVPRLYRAPPFQVPAVLTLPQGNGVSRGSRDLAADEVS